MIGSPTGLADRDIEQALGPAELCVPHFFFYDTFFLITLHLNNLKILSIRAF